MRIDLDELESNKEQLNLVIWWVITHIIWNPIKEDA